jgi:hypothetical protein
LETINAPAATADDKLLASNPWKLYNFRGEKATGNAVMSCFFDNFRSRTKWQIDAVFLFKLSACVKNDPTVFEVALKPLPGREFRGIGRGVFLKIYQMILKEL